MFLEDVDMFVAARLWPARVEGNDAFDVFVATHV
jgi:hypothetical protein